jgi:hypothetical protein
MQLRNGFLHQLKSPSSRLPLDRQADEGDGLREAFSAHLKLLTGGKFVVFMVKDKGTPILVPVKWYRMTISNERITS